MALDSSMPLDKVQLLQGVAESKKQDCVRYAFEHTSTAATVDYPSQWSA